ncbi:2'-5' RNA ligase family protein [Paenibacillus piri]|uniref:Phosphoesterase n=1 Tax=Paenibacillus piri TaxID=2547395 RepID=A0A4R5KNX1_9BACL|nr:2'-5' RNA ligase family protein [Paenibacillus piri]TDF96618.1 hypothetical protein E1757_16120 [Paenibacillus piri]
MLYGIAVFPSKEIQDTANRLRQRYDPQFAFIDPHLTLRASEDWTDDQLRDVHELLERTAAQCKPIRLHFNRFSTFFPVNNVIYLALSDPEPMQSLYKRICGGGMLAEPDKPYAYTPHLTVAQNLGDDELHDLYGSLRLRDVDIACTVDKLELLRRSADGIWEHMHAYPLTNK